MPAARQQAAVARAAWAACLGPTARRIQSRRARMAGSELSPSMLADHGAHDSTPPSLYVNNSASHVSPYLVLFNCNQRHLGEVLVF